MLFMAFASDKAGALELRKATRETHRNYLRETHAGVTIVEAGPIFDIAADGSMNMNGTLLIVEADEADHVRALMENDPYNRAGVFDTIDIRPWQRVGIVTP